jgi:RNA polymerase sigma-70 factor, ECF subfamily
LIKIAALETLQSSSIPRGSSDEKLVNLAAEGNTTAFRMLVERHSRYVTGIASRFLLKEEDTHEVVQDTFIRVWKHLKNYDRRSLFTTWLYAISFNLCLDKIRVNRRRREIRFDGNEMGMDGGENSSHGMSEPLDAEFIARAVREFARSLSRIQRQVFILRDLQDLSVEEVCQVTGYDGIKVKTNLYHARKIIREKLLKGGYL